MGDLLLDNYVPVQELAYVPHVEQGESIPQNEWLVQKELPNEPCPELGVLAVLLDGTTFPCCGSGWTRRLVVGKASAKPIADLMQKVKNRPLYSLLRDKGPGFLVSCFDRAGLPLRHELYVNRCHVCSTVLDQPQSEEIIQFAIADSKNKR